MTGPQSEGNIVVEVLVHSKKLQTVKNDLMPLNTDFLFLCQWHQNGWLLKDNDFLYDQVIVRSGLLSCSLIDRVSYCHWIEDIGEWNAVMSRTCPVGSGMESSYVQKRVSILFIGRWWTEERSLKTWWKEKNSKTALRLGVMLWGSTL